MDSRLILKVDMRLLLRIIFWPLLKSLYRIHVFLA